MLPGPVACIGASTIFSLSSRASGSSTALTHHVRDVPLFLALLLLVLLVVVLQLLMLLLMLLLVSVLECLRRSDE